MTLFWFIVYILVVTLGGGLIGYGICVHYQPLYRLASDGYEPGKVNFSKTTKYYSEVRYWYNDYRRSFPGSNFWIEQQLSRGDTWVVVDENYPDR